jgi:hypothetical protein
MGPTLANPCGSTVSDSFEITYAVHTATCTFLLDAEGFCRKIVVAPTSKRRDTARNASRCVGAQYVASLDPNVSGMLAEMPRVGAPMLFARVDDRGRVSLVRTGVVTRFERSVEDPFSTDGRDSASVATSAPMLPPRLTRESGPPPPYSEPPTEQIPRVPTSSAPTRRHAYVDPVDELETTSAYDAKNRRAPWPTEAAPPTLRQPTIPPPPSAPATLAQEEDPYARRIPRKSDAVPRGRAPAEPVARVAGLYDRLPTRRRDR